MNNTIANILKGYIDDFTWIDKIAGLVQTANIQEKIGDNITEKSYPIACDVTADACIKGHYKDLIPDSKKKSVLYFEDRGGVQFESREGGKLRYTASLRLVGWLNLKLLLEDSCGTSTGNCGVSGAYVIEIIKALPYIPFDVGDFYSITIEPPSQVERSVDIFSRYTYSEEATQYLLYPFDFFALDIDVEFTIIPEC